MTTKTINQLDLATTPLLGTDYIIVSRDGVNANQATAAQLPISTATQTALNNKPELTTAQKANSAILGVAGVGNGVIYGENGERIGSIYTSTTSMRGVAHRGGWPNANTAGQLFGVSLWDVEPANGYKLVFVGATTYLETATRAGTLQAMVEAPYGSGNWVTVYFNASTSGTFNQSDTSPSVNNNYYTLVSDTIPVNFTQRNTLRVVVTGKGGVPTMYSCEGHKDGKFSREFTIQNNSSNDAALQLASITQSQITTICNAMESDSFFSGNVMVPKVCSSSSWSGGTLTLGVLSHSYASTTNNKVVLTGFTNTGTSLNGVYDFALSGSDAITISIATDPGTISSNGIVRLAQSITSASWSGGVLTFTRAAHGYIEGQVISVRGVTSTGTSVNGDYTITSVPTVDTYTVALSSTPGTITTTNAYTFAKYIKPSAIYHLRPFTIIGNSNVACLALAGDSTTQTVDFIQDTTLLSGVTQRCVGEQLPFIDLSANNEGLNHWLTQPTQTIIRQYLIGAYSQGILFGYSKNDESAYTDSASWIAAHESWWNLPEQNALKSSKYNMAILVPSRSISSRDNFTSLEGLIKPTDTKLLDFHKFLQSKVGTLYSRIFNYNSLLSFLCQPYTVRYNDPYSIIVTTTANSAAVTVDASTPITSDVNNKYIIINGAGSSGANLLVKMLYVSPTKFIAMEPEYSVRVPRIANTAVTSVTSTVGVRKYVTPSISLSTTLHENTEAIALITEKIALKRT